MRPMPWRPGPLVQLGDDLQRVELPPVDGHRHSRGEGQHKLIRLARHRRVGGVGPHVVVRRFPDVLQVPGLARAAPQVLVDRVRRPGRHVDRQALGRGELDRLVAGHARVPDRRVDLEVRRQGGEPDLETHLVVALAGAAVRDDGGALLGGHAGQVADDQRPGQGGDQRVLVHVESIGPQRRDAERLRRNPRARRPPRPRPHRRPAPACGSSPGPRRPGRRRPRRRSPPRRSARRSSRSPPRCPGRPSRRARLSFRCHEFIPY